MAHDLSFHDVLAQLRRQDEDAARKVYDRFAGRLIALAQAKLEPRLQPCLDAEDVAQSVFKSIFRRLAEGQFALESWDSLWALLAAVAVNKCRKWRDYYYADKRNLNREVAVPDAADASWQVIDREPAPDEAAALAETLEQILQGLEKREQDMVNRSLQGDSVAEISAQLQCSAGKVYRVLNLVRQRLESMKEGDS